MFLPIISNGERQDYQDAVEGIRQGYEDVSQQAGSAGERWFVALREAIGSLSELPLRCRVAPERRDSPVEVRQLLYGRKPHVYRILFAVRSIHC